MERSGTTESGTRKNVSALERRQNPGAAAIVSVALFRARFQLGSDPGVSLGSTPGYHLTRFRRFDCLRLEPTTAEVRSTKFTVQLRSAEHEMNCRGPSSAVTILLDGRAPVSLGTASVNQLTLDPLLLGEMLSAVMSV